ncbi:MAG: hypothetical protein QNJ46_28250 [Leptolyngbyaceae cyanobacterium MO_188.B28]|nr:hypothetical protein [Leptolyngbyaceae cyanobacterium MO_188.B28]
MSRHCMSAYLEAGKGSGLRPQKAGKVGDTLCVNYQHPIPNPTLPTTRLHRKAFNTHDIPHLLLLLIGQ